MKLGAIIGYTASSQIEFLVVELLLHLFIKCRLPIEDWGNLLATAFWTTIHRSTVPDYEFEIIR